MANLLKTFVVLIAMLATPAMHVAAPALVAVTAYAISAPAAEAQTKKELKAALAALPPVTTRALVTMTDKRFENAAFQPDPDFITANIEIKFNGSNTGTIGQTITYAASATKTQVQNAVRNLTNALLDQFEPGNTLNNAQIILDGLSD